MPTTATYQGVSITLSGTHTIGYYVTGEPYIILSGASTITAIDSPPNQDYGECTHEGNAMANPIPMGTQGFCSHYVGTDAGVYVHAYDAAKDVKTQLPYPIKAGDSLTVSVMRSDELPVESPPRKVPIYKIVVFMFVSEAPPPRSLRPGFYGTDRTLAFNESDIQWDRLANYPKSGLTQCPTQAYMEDSNRFPSLPFHVWGDNWTATKMNGQLNTANTNAENSAQFSAPRFVDSALWLNLDWTIAQKRKHALQIIQNGIDIGSYHLAGGKMLASGSHQTGWKYPLFLAAVLLQDSRLLEITRDPLNFVEGKETTWRINESDVGRFLDEATPAFESGHVGTYWWGLSHNSLPNKDRGYTTDIGQMNPYHGMYSNCVGVMLGARMMQAESDWGWGIAFRYSTVHTSIFGIGSGFYSEVYNLVNPTLPAIESVTVPLPSTPQELIQEDSFSATIANPWGHPMRYTTNGSNPTDSSPLYSTPIPLSESGTIKAACYPADGQDVGSISTISFTIITNGTPAPPTNLTLS